MSHSELLEQLQQLSRIEKFQIMQCLIAELAKEEAISSFDSDTIYRVWSPYDYGDAVQKLMSLLEQENDTESRNERQNEIYNNFMLAREEEKSGKLKFSSNINELRQLIEE